MWHLLCCDYHGITDAGNTHIILIIHSDMHSSIPLAVYCQLTKEWCLIMNIQSSFEYERKTLKYHRNTFKIINYYILQNKKRI